MGRPNIEVADIFREYSHLLTGLSKEQWKVVNAIINCRTEALGGYISECSKCDYKDQSYNSCRNRHCPKCQYLKEKTVESAKEEPEETNSEFLVMGEDDMKQAKGLESTVKIDCEKCHNQEGVWWTFQTRSADEPETKFYRCTKCNHTWRDYT